MYRMGCRMQKNLCMNERKVFVMSKKANKVITIPVTVLLVIALLCGCAVSGLPQPTNAVTAAPVEASAAPNEGTGGVVDGTATRTPGAFTTGNAQIDAQLAEAKAGKKMSFAEIIYERPNMELMKSQAQAITGKVKDAATAEDLIKLVDQYNEIPDYVASVYTFVNIHTLMEPDNDKWKQEMEAMTGAVGEASSQKYEFMQAVGASPFAQEVLAQRKDLFFGFDTEQNSQAQGFDLGAFREKDAAMLAALNQAFAEAKVTYQGQSLGFVEILSAFTKPEEINAAQKLWLDTHYTNIATQYIELIKARNAAARTAGFKNYIDADLKWSGAGYTSDMASALIDNIAEEYIPFFRKARATGVENNMDTNVKVEEFLPFVQARLGEMTPELGEMFAQLTASGNLITNLPGFAQRPVTMSLLSYNTSVVLGPYTGDSIGMETVVHEFGHYYKRGTTPLHQWPVELDEIPTQALELLFLRQYEKLGAEQGLAIEHTILYEIITRLAIYSQDAAIGLKHYTIPDSELTPDSLAQATEEVNRRMARDIDVPEDMLKYSWLAAPERFARPLGDFGYVPGLCPAFELWTISLQDEAAAMEIYEKIIHDPTPNAVKVIANAGLKSPYDKGTIAAFTAVLEENFLNRDWTKAAESVPTETQVNAG